jgi:two-component system, OmpR family, sensor histidine kinase TctE
LPRAPSLTQRLLWGLVGSLAAVAVALGAGGAWLINRIVEGTSDRLLGASVRAIAETLEVEDGKLTLDLPPFALGMLENNERDNIYYNVFQDGRLVTGYPDLPQSPPMAAETSSFRYESYRGSRIRIAAEARSLPRVQGVIVVQVAETLDSRLALARQMMIGLAALEFLLVAIAALLVWPTLRWSLRPVTRLRRAMDEHGADFQPLSTQGVPVELDGLVGGFNSLLERLSSSVEGMRRFTADASHQMRTPLTILRTHLAILKKHGSESDAGRQSVADIEHATSRLQGLLTGLITLARAEEAPLQGMATMTDIKAVVREVSERLAPLAVEAGVQLDTRLPKARLRSRVDALLLSEILSNLVDNAIRYNRAGGVVRLSAEGTERICVAVEDDGPGVPASERAHVFKRFYRLHRDQPRQGSGLGLSIVEALSRQIGAEVMITDPRELHGLRAELWLPTT